MTTNAEQAFWKFWQVMSLSWTFWGLQRGAISVGGRGSPGLPTEPPLHRPSQMLSQLQRNAAEAIAYSLLPQPTELGVFSAINNCIWTGNVVSVDEAADVITIMCRTASTGRPDHTESVGLHWLDDQPRCNHSYGCRQLQSDVRRATICRDRYLANRGGPVLQRRNRLIRTDRGLYRSTDWRERTQSILLRREMDDFRSLWLWDR